MRRFCTTGPVDKETCYYVERPVEMQKALEYIENYRYFTISAPRQTGKTTFLNDVVEKIKDIYLPIFISFENLGSVNNEKKFIEMLVYKINAFLKEKLKIDISIETEIDYIGEFVKCIKELKEKSKREIILMIDEFELLGNEKIMNDFLHMIREVYHSRKEEGLRSVILISVGYLSGLLSDNASPFNIAEHLWLPDFTKEQICDLLSQHEEETNQMFDEQVKELIWHNAAGQPGLTNALAYDLVENKAKNEKLITKQHFDKTLYDFTYVYIDRNISNILSKAEKEQDLMLQILFDPKTVQFNVYDDRIKFLYLHGVIDNCDGVCCVKVPLYYKTLYAKFKPRINGEQKYMISFRENLNVYIDENGLKLNELLKKYDEYIKSRGAKMFKGQRLYEGAYQYNLDLFLSTYMEELGGEIHPEVEIGGGRVDLLLTYKGKKYIVEIKIDVTPRKYEEGKRQLIEYMGRSGLKEGWYVIFDSRIEETMYEQEEKEGKIIHIWWIKTKYEKPSKA